MNSPTGMSENETDAAGSESPLSVLAIVDSPGVFELVRPFLDRSRVAARRILSAAEGLRLCETSAPGLVVTQYPWSGLTPRDFFDRYFISGSASAETPLLVVTREDRAAEIRKYLEGRKARACCIESTDDGQLHQALYELIGISARCEGRLLITAEVDFGDSSVERVFQTVNLSKSGALLQSRKPLDIGVIVPFRLQLPEARPPIRAIGEVVRTSDPALEGIHGIGLRILDFEADGQDRLARFVESRLPRRRA